MAKPYRTLGEVSSMPLKGTGETRGKTSRRPAWLRGHKVSSNEVISTYGEQGPWLKTLPDGPLNGIEFRYAE